MSAFKQIVVGLVAGVTVVCSHAQTKLSSAWQSDLVKISNEGLLTYMPDEEGNTIPDFSRVGYHHGNRSIPRYPAVKEIFPVENGDSREVIQQAIDEISRRQPDQNGHRGTILLRRGVYRIADSIVINTGGIVLTGEGSNVNETRLIATGKKRRSLIQVKGSGGIQEVQGTRTKITDDFVPIGTHSFRVSSVENYQAGDRVIVYRPGTQEWIHAIKMDQIVERKGTRQWTPQEYNLAFEREITRIEGDRLFIDNPVVMQMDKKYGGGEVYKYTFEGRISEVGISDMCIESEFEDYEDLDHGWIAVELDKAENCWVENITVRYFGYSAVSCERFAKNVSVINSRCLESKSLITGGYRYSFNNWGQQNLFMDCQATEGRHDYVTGAQVCGPNVFYNCTASQTFADIGPHHRWSVGTLYDNIITDGEINVQDRGQMGSGHGWAGVTQVLWNCRAKRAAVQNPWTSGKNYNIGMKGEKYPGHFTDRPEGVWEGQNEINIFPRSLYIAQLMARQKKGNLCILIK
ncbi:hypothetical protein [Parabacteroides gordonii]|jgi:hypothetical protein|uniref:hypothetical protein n=1 Tax=Parabacteroides gordonii TaxID=574930 RepID=UPI0024201F07|nr:hypothetical protein [Parabacteroides gordonii]